MRETSEWQFDGLVGPTHNYAGLAHGNVASATHAGAVSNPRLAALQGIEKMRFVASLGVPQAFLPPHLRPIIPALQQLGFSSLKTKYSIGYSLDLAFRMAPDLLASVYSSSFMWVANAATIIPSADSFDGKMHLIPANLSSHFHRSLEHSFTKKLLKNIFHNTNYFDVHNSLPSTPRFADEGAANHMRISTSHTHAGNHIFVYGRGDAVLQQPMRYPARQNRESCEAIARLGRLKNDCTFFVQQNPAVIDQGVFHNDVIAMNSTRLMILHAESFMDQKNIVAALEQSLNGNLTVVSITADELSVAEAVATYFFNSQMLEVNNGKFVVIAPSECEQHPKANPLFSRLQGEGILQAVHYRDVRESMRNGGGPACLRLRVVLNAAEAAALHPGIILTDQQYVALKAWVEKYYRDRLTLNDLRDVNFMYEVQDAMAALETLLGMPGLYGLEAG